jgi:hypothetical protein
MSDGFLYIKSEHEIIQLDKIIRFSFQEEDDEEEAVLRIYCIGETDGEHTYRVEGDDAEKLYIELIKVLPNLITIGK